ncbi:MAG: GAF domain-containing protein, partial [Anaerolineales bacterium]|nr:GAF domain-containing protein [Anaerolineales bacterium]
MVAENGKLAWSTNLEQETDYLREGILEAGYRTIVAVPLPVRGEVVGVLSLAFKGIRRISQREVGLLEAIGAGVGVGIENARLNRQARRIAVIEERERIGMDLHDGIIQSIYAVGLTLDSIRVMIGDNPDEALALLERAIDGLNANIRDIRSYILDLQPSRFEGTDLEQGLSRLSQEFKANTMVDIDTRIEPEAVSKIDGEVSRTLLHITQEALANVAKHANASRVWVSMRKLEDCIYLQIIDNGIGFDLERQPELLGHGLSNMDQRARQVSGEFEAVSSPGEGTTITVRIDSNSAGI